jgi:hypothetical protein
VAIDATIWFLVFYIYFENMLVFLLFRLRILWLDTVLKFIQGAIGFILYMICLIYLLPLILPKECIHLSHDYRSTDGMINSLSVLSNPFMSCVL